MPQSMQVVRGLLAANPDYWPAKADADGTTSSAYLRATVYEDRPRVRQKDGSYTDNPLGPVRTTVKFWGQAAELLHGMDFRQGDAVVATGRMGDPDAFISQKDGKAYARPVVIGDSMQIDSIVSQRIQLARERKRQDKEQAGAVADAGRTDPWTDQVDASRGEYVGDGVPRTFNGEPFEPLSGYPTPARPPLRRTLRHRISFPPHPISRRATPASHDASPGASTAGPLPSVPPSMLERRNESWPTSIRNCNRTE